MENRTDRVIPIANLREFFRDSVDNALANQRIEAADQTAYYIVNLLTIFARSEQLYERTSEGTRLKPLALMLAEALESDSGTERSMALQRLGDVSLFIAGCFADSLARKPVDIDYYISMGGGAYGTLSSMVRGTVRGRTFGSVFSELASKFQAFVDVLAEVSEMARVSSDRDILRLYEIWIRTGSRRAAALLRKLGIEPASGAVSHHTH